MFFTNPGQPNLDERLKGYKEVFAGYPGIKIVDVFDIKTDPGSALDRGRLYILRGRVRQRLMHSFLWIPGLVGTLPKLLSGGMSRTGC